MIDVWVLHLSVFFRRIWGNKMDGLWPSIFLYKVLILKSKKDSLSSKSVFLGEGIFTMGLVKTIYNVLGGFYI